MSIETNASSSHQENEPFLNFCGVLRVITFWEGISFLLWMLYVTIPIIAEKFRLRNVAHGLAFIHTFVLLLASYTARTLLIGYKSSNATAFLLGKIIFSLITVYRLCFFLWPGKGELYFAEISSFIILPTLIFPFIIIKCHQLHKRFGNQLVFSEAL